ncbi:amidase [Leucobacter ruminantium]|uniref:Amidase n=1 Tax=Leucobacter ruminantium TaxID=1289170 RepID=A0A939LU45_9MICO|nr:amidase [Leucobacter ruminantium]MBO1804417.1 amidase [Leucobacter ruminantium]
MSALPETAVALRDALRRGEVTAVEAVEHFLGRISEGDDLDAFIAVSADRARDEAHAADARFAATPASERAGLPPLHGMPIAFKDLVDVIGSPTTFGTAALPVARPARDSPGVAALHNAGAISLGKTQVPEFGLNAYSENRIAPPARNPLDPSRTPGGSSGGSAAAVAAGMLPVAPGSDGGGSVRIPALACGLVGLKPGLGSVPADLLEGPTPGPVDPFGAPRLAVSGPLARTPEDAALLYDAMRGHAGASVTGSASAGPGASGGEGSALAAVRTADALTGLRIGLSAASPFEAAHPTPLTEEAREAWEIAASRLAERGHRVEEAEFRYDPRYPETFARCWTAGLSLLELPEGGADRLTDLARVFRERALGRSLDEHLESAAVITAIAADFRDQWGAYDIVLTPGLAAPPPAVGAFMSLAPDDDYRAQCEWTPFTSMVNVSGLPAIAVPTLELPGGLSMGVQLIGRAGSEAQLLRLAAQLMRC